MAIGEEAGRGAERSAGASRFLIRATQEHPSAVLLRVADAAELQDLDNRAIERKSPGRLPRSQANAALLESWVGVLGPHFDGKAAASLTLTYSNEYGYSHGLMLARNVRADFLRAVQHQRPDGFIPWTLGIEHHNTGRDILHAHAMLGGWWFPQDMAEFKAYWTATRGWCRIAPVTASGGCVAYCAKHLLKRGAADNFDFGVDAFRKGSRAARRALNG